MAVSFHAVYRIEEKLGRRFAELRPYALFPLDEYFANTIAEPEKKPVAVKKTPRFHITELIGLPMSA